jgi:uncharacterized membrane protein
VSRSFLTMLWAIVALYAALILLRPLGLIPGSLNAPLGALLPLGFALLHGSKQYRWRDMLAFTAICLVVSNAFENLSILTGFPFGHYHYGPDLGPKLFLVPVLIGIAYLGVGYLSWTLARLILGGKRPRRERTVAVPLIASFIMVSWDLTLDPVASTIGGSWIWRDGGAYFGVPISNFLGWYLTVYVFFQLFALYLGRSPARPQRNTIQALQSLWWPVWAMAAATAFRPVLTLLFRPPGSPTVIDPAGVAWNVAAIYGVCALGAIFGMGAFLVLALVRLSEGGAERRASAMPCLLA